MAKSFLFIVRKQVEKLKVFLHKRKVFGSISKSLKFFNFSRKPICLRIDCMDHRMQLSQPCLKLFNLMPRKTSFKDGIGWKTYHFSKKSKNVPLDRWIAVLITPPKSLQQMVESFTHNVRKCWEMSCFFLKKFLSSKCSDGWKLEGLQPWQPRWINFDKKQNFSDSSSWKLKRCFFIQNKLLHKRISYGHVSCSFDSPAISLTTKKWEFVHSKTVKVVRKLIYLRNLLGMKMFLRTRRLQFWQLS